MADVITMSNFQSIGQGVRGLWPPEIGGFPLTLKVALTTVLRTNVLHCDCLSFLTMYFSYCTLNSPQKHLLLPQNCLTGRWNDLEMWINTWIMGEVSLRWWAVDDRIVVQSETTVDCRHSNVLLATAAEQWLTSVGGRVGYFVSTWRAPTVIHVSTSIPLRLPIIAPL